MCLPLCLRALFFLAFMACSANGYKFIVGGSSGWTLNPAESYSHWAERNRFQVNDTLYFKYDKDRDSVIYVDEEDYKNCNPNNPLHKLEGGESVFQFGRSGPFFFITGNVTNCQHGQKLIVLVLAVRPPPPSPHVQPPSTPPSPAPASTPPSTPPAASAPTLVPTSAPAPTPSASEVSPPPKNGAEAAAFGLVTVLLAAVFSLIVISV
uniref:Phytocyanin domain-containing protein n=1 Tax=Kalanchoe fedtschenkoi TaxID=63787 RepID=A0A7N0SXZ1_KALFE